ncbi:site-specific DNA-methyltransferase, partial [Jiulongibacter sediminis]|uniref:site-specific DNA-methyltransferase n=1 Tax=Jiulongibacter sediminis TaxID=1605367 RepID=UPI0026EDB786
MNKKDILDKIKSLDGLSNEERAYLVNLVNTKKKYGLVWEDKPEEVEEQLRTKLPILKEVKERAIINDTETEKHPNHILIEGDNLHALTALTFTHENKIDLIYIDPPYNTGNKDFAYKDAYKDEYEFIDRQHPFRHSTWLSFIFKRIKIAHNLLTDNGLISISIDDNEYSQLKLVCDEIFGEKNFIANICQKHRHSISNDLIISQNHNYLLVYAKNFDNIFERREFFRLDKVIDEKKFKNPDNDPKGPYKLNPVDGPGGARKGNPYYEFLGIEGYYRYSYETMKELYDKGEIVKRRNSLGRKYYLSKAKEKAFETVTTWWDDAGTTTVGTRLLKSVIPDCTFTNPKPIELINRILQLNEHSPKEFIILDFFAGSGTTLHAAMELNKEDNGSRQSILVTNNENNIAEEVTYERNKRVIQGYTNAKGVQVEGLKNNNLRYYQCKFVEREPSLANKRQLTQLATELLCIKEDCYQEVTSTLNSEAWNKLFANGKGQFVYVVYDDLYIEEAVEALTQFVAHEAPESKIKVYVFANGQYAYSEEFEDIAENITLAALP